MNYYCMYLQIIFNPLIVQWLLYVPPVLTFWISTFCPHCVFMCFVWIWEQTAIISLCSINWLVFISDTERVYCAVRSAHSVFMCFVWIWEQTATSSLYWLVFRRVRKITKKRLVASLCLSFRLSTWKNSAPTGRIFMKYGIRAFQNLSRKFKFY
jgi:hypothetical protein